MKQPRKHADLIKAWADGAQIQWYDDSIREHRWKDCGEYFDWGCPVQFRIKPEPKPDFVYYGVLDEPARGGYTLGSCFTTEQHGRDQLKIIFHGETGNLKSAEVL